MLNRKRHVSTFLFSIFFLLYVASPFCFTKEGLPTEGDPSAYQLNFSIKNIRVVWELFHSGHDRQRDSDGSHDVQLLIKKARAVVSTNGNVKYTVSESAESGFNEIIYPQKIYTPLTLDDIPSSRSVIHLSVSGLSPPEPGFHCLLS
ncbi:MAG: hypothetical protein AB1499_14980 [Nitrospirota bacterium]